MTDTPSARAQAWARLVGHIRGVAVKRRYEFVPYELLSMGGDQAIAMWIDGEVEKGQTFEDVMYSIGVNVRAYWMYPKTEATAKAFEGQLWDLCREIQAVVMADVDLGGLVSGVSIGLMSTGAGETVGEGVEGLPVRVMTLPLVIEELNAEEIRKR